MRTTSTAERSVVLCMALMLTLGACGGDDDAVGGDEAVVDDAEADAASEDQGDGDDAQADTASDVDDADQGMATLTVDGQLFTTDNTFCNIVDSGTDRVEFNYFGTGNADGKPFTVTASIVSTDDGGDITIVDSMAVTQTSPTAVLWTTPTDAIDRAESDFSVNGEFVTYGADVIEPISETAGRASFVATCS